ncbi:MAG TPA: hypothetical protein VFE47_23700 [Tepidisphaeraceae bacterium]|jgi:hypothetical protein|nr:hypothetical protein [Tepidisphaeraceae bacterium]
MLQLIVDIISRFYRKRRWAGNTGDALCGFDGADGNIVQMPRHFRLFWRLAILAVAVELGFDSGVSLWGLSHVFRGQTWGLAPCLIGASRGILVVIAVRYALRGYCGARIAMVVFDAMEAALGFAMSFLALVINADGHGVRNFATLLLVSSFFGGSAWVIGAGLKPKVVA